LEAALRRKANKHKETQIISKKVYEQSSQKAMKHPGMETDFICYLKAEIINTHWWPGVTPP
jgi:hypothetical protein